MPINNVPHTSMRSDRVKESPDIMDWRRDSVTNYNWVQRWSRPCSMLSTECWPTFHVTLQGTRSHDEFHGLVYPSHIASPFIRCFEYDTMSSSTFLNLFDPLDIIGYESLESFVKFGRKTDGWYVLLSRRPSQTLISVVNRFSHERSWILKEWVRR